MQKFEFLRRPLLGELAMSRKKERKGVAIERLVVEQPNHSWIEPVQKLLITWSHDSILPNILQTSYSNNINFFNAER